MALNFPSSPSNGDLYENYIYNSTEGTWQLVSIDNIYTGASIAGSPPNSPESGDMWWDSDNGTLFIYYNDGTNSQWVDAAGPGVAVQDTAPTGYEGQLWLDSTDGSMYVYYTDPGGTNAQWIGAVSRSGGILQVVQATRGTSFSSNSDTWVDITDLAVTVTPSSTASKFLLTYSIPGISLDGSRDVHFKLTRNNTVIGTGDSSFGSAGFVRQVSSDSTVFTQTFLDLPATTSSLTYQVQMRVAATDATATLAGNDRGLMSVTAMEVAG